MTITPNQKRWSLKRILSSAVLVVAALAWWAFTDQMGSPLGQAGAFACAVACLAGAFWPHHGLSLVIAGIMALALDPARLDEPNAWNVLFLILCTAGLFHLLRRYKLLAWMASSFPSWAMSRAAPPLIYIALAFVFVGLALAGVRPLLSRARRTGVEPVPGLGRGPLIEVPERRYRFRKGTKFLKTMVVLCGLACLAGGVLWLNDFEVGGMTLALSSAIIGLTFGFSLWFATRLHFRIDGRGVHARVLFGEKSIAWHELGGLTLRYLYFPGFGLRYTYYCILSPEREITFPDSMTGAGELCELIEKASGLRWPAPAPQ